MDYKSNTKVSVSINTQPAGHMHILSKLLPAVEFGVLAFAAWRILDGLTLITQYSVWGRGGAPSTLINDSPVLFAAGSAVAGPGQMACDRLCYGATLVNVSRAWGETQVTSHIY